MKTTAKSRGPAASVGHDQATRGPAASEGRRQVARDPAPSEEHYCPAANGGAAVAQGPAVSGERQAVRILLEEEEESTGSEDEIGGSACEDMRDIASKNRTHLGPTPFKNLRRLVLMEFAEPSPISHPMGLPRSSAIVQNFVQHKADTGGE